MSLTVSALDKTQWASVVRNSVFTFLTVLLASLTVSQDISRPALLAALSAAGMAVLKVVEKAFTPVN